MNTWDLYAADNWKFKNNLSLNYGVRYDYEGPVHSDYPNLSVFDPSLPSGLAVAGVDVPNIYNKFWGAVSPRVGFAYTPGEQRQDRGPRRLRPLLRLHLYEIGPAEQRPPEHFGVSARA